MGGLRRNFLISLRHGANGLSYLNALSASMQCERKPIDDFSTFSPVPNFFSYHFVNAVNAHRSRPTVGGDFGLEGVGALPSFQMRFAERRSGANRWIGL